MFSSKPSPENPNNGTICTSCWSKLNAFHEFYVSVEQAHSCLISSWSATATTAASSDILSTAIEIAGIKMESDIESDLESTSSDEDEYYGDESVNEDDFDIRNGSPDLDEFIHKNMKLSCDICQKPLYNFYMLRRHFESVHEESGYVICCNLKFKKRNSLANHIYLDHNLIDFDDENEQVVTECKTLNFNAESDDDMKNCLSSINVTNSVTLHFKNPVQKDKLHQTLNEIRSKF